MANLTESSLWEPGIYRWEDTDPIQGGEAGIDNVPTRQLANRTRWLRDHAVLDNEPRTITSLHTFSAGLVTGLIHRGTAGEADNGSLALSGGGGVSAERGGNVVLYGNEHASDPGSISYSAGVGGRHRFLTYDAGGVSRESVQIATNGVLKVAHSRAQFGGTALPATGYGVEIAHDGAQGSIESYNRSTQQWKSLYVNASHIELHTQGTGNLYLDPNGAVVFGPTHLNTSGAARGDAVLQNSRHLRAMNAAGTATVPLVGLNGANQVAFSQPLYTDNNVTIQASLRMATTVSAGASTGDIIMANGATVRGVNAAGTGALSMIAVGAGNELRLGANTGPVAVGAVLSSALAGAATGEVVFGNSANLRWANAAGTAALPALQVDAANDTRIGWSAGAGMYLNTFHNAVAPGQTSWTGYVNWGNAAGMRRILCSNAPPAGAFYLYYMP